LPVQKFRDPPRRVFFIPAPATLPFYSLAVVPAFGLRLRGVRARFAAGFPASGAVTGASASAAVSPDAATASGFGRRLPRRGLAG
jgi:hypothetical protein